MALYTGDWSEAKLLPSNINSPYDEDFPFLNADGTTFYFSSKGHNSMGGYDILDVISTHLLTILDQ